MNGLAERAVQSFKLEIKWATGDFIQDRHSRYIFKYCITLRQAGPISYEVELQAGIDSTTDPNSVDLTWLNYLQNPEPLPEPLREVLLPPRPIVPLLPPEVPPPPPVLPPPPPPRNPPHNPHGVRRSARPEKPPDYLRFYSPLSLASYKEGGSVVNYEQEGFSIINCDVINRLLYFH